MTCDPDLVTDAAGRFTAYLTATPATLRAAMAAVGLERRQLADRFFDEADVRRLCRARFGIAPGPLEWHHQVGAATVAVFDSEFEHLGGGWGTTWGWRFWDPATDRWSDAAPRRGLQAVQLSFYELPEVGRDGNGSGSWAVRLYDHDADWLLVFSVGTHRATVLTAGTGVAGIEADVRAVLGA